MKVQERKTFFEMGSRISLRGHVRPSVSPSVRPYVSPSVCPFVHMSVRMFVRPLALKQNRQKTPEMAQNCRKTLGLYTFPLWTHLFARPGLLDVSLHLCLRVCLSVHLSVCPSICPYVCPSVSNLGKPPKTAQNRPKHYGFILIHIGRIYMLGQACCFPNAIKH